jgi:hypothetical protein
MARENSQNTQAVERVHAQSALILESVKTHQKAACDNLLFFVNLGLIDDAKKTIRTGRPHTVNPIPSLPPLSIDSVVSLDIQVVDGDDSTPLGGASIDVSGVKYITRLSDARCSWSFGPPPIPRQATVSKDGYEKQAFMVSSWSFRDCFTQDSNPLGSMLPWTKVVIHLLVYSLSYPGRNKLVKVERLIFRVFVSFDVALHLAGPFARFQIRYTCADSRDVVVLRAIHDASKA